MFPPECFKTCYLLHYMLISAFKMAENSKLLRLMEFSKNEVWYETFISGMLLYCIWRRQLHSNVSDGLPYHYSGVSCALEECFPREWWELNSKLDRIFALLHLTFEFTNCSIMPWFCWFVLADRGVKLRAHL